MKSLNIPERVFKGGHKVAGVHFNPKCQVCDGERVVHLQTSDHSFARIVFSVYDCGAEIVDRSQVKASGQDLNRTNHLGAWVLVPCRWAHRRYVESMEEAK